MNQNNNIPKLRFPEFSDTWENKKLGEIGNFIGGGTPSTKNANFWNGDVPWISSSDISDESIYKINKSRFISREAISQTATKLIPAKSILIVSRVGVGKVAINETEICTSQDFTNLIVELDNYIFLAYLIKFKTNKLLEFNQGTSIKGFVKSDLENLEINIPSLPEQTKIATFLTAVDEKLTQLKQKKELLSQYKKGVMQQIFSQKLRFKDDNGNDFEDWEEKNLSDLAKIMYGKDQKQVIDENGKYPILGTGGIIGKTNSFLCNKASVLIGRKGTIDKPVYMETPFWSVDTLFYTDVFSNTFPKWLYFQFQNINWYLYNEASGVPSLSASTIYKIKIQLPCFSEQTKIANFLSALDEKISNAENKITLMEQWKKGLLQKMFI
ncbi:MAG TPA: restriction endonuclease subunit S [Bacteroidales bacterium]|nr:MAG: hypothetical protein A2W98_03180 [Bacteroidetes bacterium GWF2_33_38]HBF87065.1 restriction endonuclease subunit S [Bacteroidales bacterium]